MNEHRPEFTATCCDGNEDERTDGGPCQHNHLGREFRYRDLDQCVRDSPGDPENQKQDEATASHFTILRGRDDSVQPAHCQRSTVLGQLSVVRGTIT